MRFGDSGSAVRVVVDPARRLAERAPHAPVALAQHRGRLRARRWPTSSSATSTTSAPPRSTSRGAVEARPWTAEELRAEGPGFGLEVVGIESAKPERIVPVLEALAGKAYRIRAVGSIAISLCYVAGGRFDGMLTGRACRSVDAAAGQLVAREAGAEVAFDGRRPGREPRPRRPIPRGRRARRRDAGDGARGAGAGRAGAGGRGLSASRLRRLGAGPAGRRGGWRATTARPGLFDQEALDSACAEAAALVARLLAPRPDGAAATARAGRSRRVGAARPANAARALRRARAPDRRRDHAPGPARGHRPLAGRGAAGAEAGSRGRLRGAQGPRPVRRRAGPTERQPRLVFVGPEPRRRAHSSWARTPGVFLRWIAIHETTHALQFASVPWLRAHLAGLLEQLIDGASARLDQGSLRALARAAAPQRPARRDPRAPARRPAAPARRARAGAHARSPPGDDVGDRGSCRARHGRRRRATSSPATPAFATGSRPGAPAAAGSAR